MKQEQTTKFTSEQLESVKSIKGLVKYAKQDGFSVQPYLNYAQYDKELRLLQTELVNLQRWIVKKQLRVAVIMEGRDAAGKGGAIKRYVEHLNPRSSRVVALTKPTKVEMGQWYFRRYVKELPDPGEIVFFDRSWYNRAVVEPVMGFCTPQQYAQYMVQVPEFEHMLYEDGVIIIKLWFSVTKKEQQERFDSRIKNPLKEWKYSEVDKKGQELWDRYTHFKEQMFSKTHTPFCPWVIVNANSKKKARLESMRYILSQFDFLGKRKPVIDILPDPNYISRYYRQIIQLD